MLALPFSFLQRPFPNCLRKRAMSRIELPTAIVSMASIFSDDFEIHGRKFKYIKKAL